MAVEVKVPGLFSYLVPENLTSRIAVGQAVMVPFGHRISIGYVMALKELGEPVSARLKPIKEIVREEALFGPSLTSLINFIAHYYFYPPGLCAKEILPGGLSPVMEKVVVLAPEKDSQTMIGAEAELVERLREALPEGLPIQDLHKEGFEKTIKKMSADGQVTLSWRLSARGTRPAYEWWLGEAPTPPPSPPRLGPRERELWELVKDGPPKPLSYYASYIKNPLPKARSLVEKGLAALEQKEVFRDDPSRALNSPNCPAPKPTAQQAKALEKINQALDSREFKGFMLFGVTGSGKTEVYLRAAEHALAQGREVLWLAPEIGLTMGLEGLIRNRLGAEKLAVLHSGLTPGQRHDQWLRIKRGKAPVVLGARSAVFAPLEKLGLIIVDEEHDWAYKQDDGLRYNGRDLARRRAAESGAALILGSATPSFESYQAALDERLELLIMKDRAGTAVLPEVEIVDQGAEPSRLRQPLSPILSKRLHDTLERGEQALLFINRRGMANLPMCLKCGEALKCPHCSRTLTLHGADESGGAEACSSIGAQQTLICHCCGYRAAPPQCCPACLSPLFRYLGVGTEKLLKIAEERFPKAKGDRLDTDSVRKRGGLKKVLDSFAKGECNVLVGTQMAAKGHDFPNLTLVGVVDADMGLNLPDFRAAERTFQLLSQVAGRAGRAEAPGTVLIQTLNPRHPVLLAAAAHDYETFFTDEIEARAELGYPPFSRLALIRFSGPDEMLLAEAAEKARDLAFPAGGGLDPGLELLGPVPSPVAKIKDRYRYQLLIRAASTALRHRFLAGWLPAAKAAMPAEIRLTVDIDPYHLM